MLGYGIDPGYEPLAEALRKLVGGRHDRNDRIIRKLQMLGVRISFEDVKKHAGEEVVGRPHIANALIEKGAVKNFDEAFEKYLARGAAAYCERFRLTPEEAIGLIAQSGGVSVLAHPYLIRVNDDALEALIRKLKDVGLAGIEAYYSEHSDEQTRNYLDLARRYDLLVTGGTDYHGAIKPDIALGSGRGDLAVPYEVFDNLRNALNGHA
jgi:predicted metal-dependent phosphoesterase TrpH